MGAWIETFMYFPSIDSIESLPSWERGLKLRLEFSETRSELSLPSWERGLKLNRSIFFNIFRRRSLRGSVD